MAIEWLVVREAVQDCWINYIMRYQCLMEVYLFPEFFYEWHLNIGATTYPQMQLKLNIIRLLSQGMTVGYPDPMIQAFASGHLCMTQDFTDGRNFFRKWELQTVSFSHIKQIWCKNPHFLHGWQSLHMGGTTYYFNTSGIINASTVDSLN